MKTLYEASMGACLIAACNHSDPATRIKRLKILEKALGENIDESGEHRSGTGCVRASAQR